MAADAPRRHLQKSARAFMRGLFGEMAEWLKAHAWKACVRETVPWVRIPLSPPINFQPLDPLDRNGEHVPHTAFGPDDPRGAGVTFELAPEAENLHIDAAVEDVLVNTSSLQ